MKKSRIYLIVALFLVAVPLATSAYTLRTDNSLYLVESDSIEGNLYALSSSIIIDGTVNGDVYCLGQTVTINGRVEGDVFCAGEAIVIAGEVGGSIRVAANTVNITGSTTRNVQVLGLNVTLGPESSVGWDALFGAGTVDIRGPIQGDLHGMVGGINIDNNIGGDVKLRIDERLKGEKYSTSYTGPKPLTINEGVSVGGNLYYTAGLKGDIAETVTIGGEIGHSLPKKIAPSKEEVARVVLWFRIILLFGMLAVGGVLISLFRKNIMELSHEMLENPSGSIGWGIITMFVAPMIALLLMFTLIGIPLATILICFWLIAMYFAKIVVSIIVGKSILERYARKKEISLVLAMVFGTILTWLIYSLPGIGWIFKLVAVWWGLGGLWLYVRKNYHNEQ